MNQSAIRLTTFIALIASFSWLLSLTFNSHAVSDQETLIWVRYNNQAQLSQLSAYDLWEIDPQTQEALILVSSLDLQELQNSDWSIRIDDVATTAFNTPLDQRTAETFFGGYRTTSELYTDLNLQATTYPHLAELVDYGDSHCLTSGGCTTPGSDEIAGYDLYALRLTNEATGGTSVISGTQVISGTKPVFFLMAAIHAREISTAEVAMRYADWLLSRYGTDADVTWLLDYHEIWVIPVANPDGHEIVWLGEQNSGTPYYHRKNVNMTGCTTWPSQSSNHFGIDLNRNHSSLEWGTTGVSTSPCASTYGGTGAGSEVEIQHVEALIKDLIPDQRGSNVNDAAPADATGIFIVLHSYGEFVLWPWGNSYRQTSANDTEIEMIGEKFAAQTGYFGCQPGVDTWCLGAVSGASEDWVYETLGIPAYTFELGREFFVPFSTMENEQWPENLPAFFYASKIADHPYQRIHGPDVTAVFTASNSTHITVTATLDETTTGGQATADGRYAIGAPLSATPLLTGTLSALGSGVSVSRTLVTETSTTGGVRGAINISSLDDGRYLLFIYGLDELGNEGPPTAIWITVAAETEPPTEPVSNSAYLPLISKNP